MNRLSAPALPVPAFFKDAPVGSVEVYSPTGTRNFADNAKRVQDADAEIGVATRLLMSEVPDEDRAKYNLPMPWGVYDTLGKTNPAAGQITAADIPGAGYHWYKLSDVKLTGNDYIYFFWSWNIQLDIPDGFDSTKPDQKFDVWAEIKFEGPSFPHANAGEADAISVSRIALVKK